MTDELADRSSRARARERPWRGRQERMLSAAEPVVLEDLESAWGASWGASDEIGPLRRVVVRAAG